MPNFILIDPTTKTMQNLETADYKDALLAAGLDPLTIEHAPIGQIRGAVYTIWVYEFSLITPVTVKYFAIGKQLYNGPAVLMASNQIGETISIPSDFIIWLPSVTTWLNDIDAVERNIAEGKVNRPRTTVNDEVVWEWNKPTETFN